MKLSYSDLTCRLERLGMNVRDFSERTGTSVWTIRGWRRADRVPSIAVAYLDQMISVQAALAPLIVHPSPKKPRGGSFKSRKQGKSA